MKNSEEELIVVDIYDNVQSTATKSVVHSKGLLHRAFSILIHNSTGELLLQRRAHGKYHSAGLWSNSCCGHPRLGEEIETAAKRRLKEELGFTCDLNFITTITYSLPLGNGMIENEFTHVFQGIYDGGIFPNDEEVSAIRWIEPTKLLKSIEDNAEHYTAWFKVILDNNTIFNSLF